MARTNCCSRPATRLVPFRGATPIPREPAADLGRSATIRHCLRAALYRAGLLLLFEVAAVWQFRKRCALLAVGLLVALASLLASRYYAGPVYQGLTLADWEAEADSLAHTS